MRSNTGGPIPAADHYRIPPLSRIDLEGVLKPVRNGRYFALHAPRQTGKTFGCCSPCATASMPGGAYRCVYANVEVGQTAREDVGRAMRAILGELAECASDTLGGDFVEDVWLKALARYGADRALRRTLAFWARADSRPSCCSLTKSTRWSATRWFRFYASCARATTSARVPSRKAQLVNRMYAVFIAAVRQALGDAGAASPVRRDHRR